MFDIQKVTVLPTSNPWNNWIVGVMFHMPYMPSVTKCDIKKIGVIFYQLKIIGCNILNVHLA